MTIIRSCHNQWQSVGAPVDFRSNVHLQKNFNIVLHCFMSCTSSIWCIICLEVNLHKVKFKHLYCLSPDSKSLVWPGRNNMWTFFGPLLGFFWCNTNWESSHQNAHSGELQFNNVNNAGADFSIKLQLETCDQ